MHDALPLLRRLRVGVERVWRRVLEGIPRGSPVAAAGAEAIGRAGERAAVAALRREGYAILARRVRVAGVEIDVLALDGPTLVLVEVKATGREGARPAGRVDAHKRARMRRAAAHLASHRPGGVGPLRLDVVEVVFGEGRPRCAVRRGHVAPRPGAS